MVNKPADWVKELPPDQRKEVEDFEKRAEAIAAEYRKKWKSEKK